MSEVNNVVLKRFLIFILAASAPPPTKRPNKDPMPSYRPSPEQYAAMIEAAKEAGQPLPSTHVSEISNLSLCNIKKIWNLF